MKNLIKTFIAALIVIASFVGAFSPSNSNAKAVEKSDWLIFTRVVENNGEAFIYVFTEGGVFISKYEEL